MDTQHDLFDETLPPLEEVDIPLPEVLPLAAPCGWLNRRNKPCQRLGHRAMRCEGRQLRSCGRPVLHCEIACFNGAFADEMSPNRDLAGGAAPAPQFQDEDHDDGNNVE